MRRHATLKRPKTVLTIVLTMIAATAVVLIVKSKLADDARDASHAVNDIEAELGGLDPAARAAALTKLSADAVKHAKASRAERRT